MDREFEIEFKRRNDRGIENLIGRAQIEEQEEGKILNLKFDDIRYSHGILTLFPTEKEVEEYKTKHIIPSGIFGIALHDKKNKETDNYLTRIHYNNRKITKACTTDIRNPKKTIYRGFNFLRDLGYEIIKKEIGHPQLRENLSHIVEDKKEKLIRPYLTD